MRLLPLSSSREREKVALVAGPLAWPIGFRQDRPRPLCGAPYLRIASMNIARMANGKCEKGRICAVQPFKKNDNLSAIDTASSRALAHVFPARARSCFHLIDPALLALNDVFAGGNAAMQERPWRRGPAGCISR